MSEYTAMLLGVTLLSAMGTLLLVAIPYRVWFTRWMKRLIERLPDFPGLGRADAVQNSTVGRLLFSCLVGLVIIGIVASRLVPRLWDVAVPFAREVVVLAATGGVLAAVGAVLLVAARAGRIPRRRRRIWVGGVLLAAGAASIVTVVAVSV